MLYNPHDDKFYWDGHADGVKERDCQWFAALRESGVLPSDSTMERYMDPLPEPDEELKAMHTRSAKWWTLCFIHNCAVHPLLPLADALQTTMFAKVVYWLHDNTVPKGGG